MTWYLEALMSYADFGGRASRRQFWGFLVVHLFVSFLLVFGDAILTAGSNAGYGVLSGLYWLATLVPALAVAVRRLHDIGRSGLWVLIGFVPVLGALVLLLMALLEGEPGANGYGPNPRVAPA
jgi:uncharacterized membrane protein YhaH (DUF805 family)